MAKKIFSMVGVLLVTMLMVACTSLQIPGLSAAAQPSQSARPGGFTADPAKMPVDQKLGIGILMLEGTPQAVTASQAKDLLLLWKGVKALNSSSTTSQEEISGLYQQIEETLTPEQVQAIQKMTWTQEEMRATMEKFGMPFARGGGGFGGSATQDPSARATRIAQAQSQGRRNNNGGFGGPSGGGGFTGPGGPGGFNQFPGGGQGGTNIQRTPVPGQARRVDGGLNSLLADAVIRLLQQRAGL